MEKRGRIKGGKRVQGRKRTAMDGKRDIKIMEERERI